MSRSLEPIRGLWIGPKLSLMERTCISSFLAHGHPFELFVYEKVRDVPKGVTIRDANEVLPASSIFTYQSGFGKGGVSGFANLFRLKLLSEMGGWWCDLDVICLRPFVFEAPVVISSGRLADGSSSLNNGIMKAPAGDPFFVDCYEKAKAMDARTLQHAQNGGQLLNSLLDKHGYRKHLVSPETFNPIDPGDWQNVLKKPFVPAEFQKSVAIHLWSEMWNRALKKSGWKHFIKRHILRNIPDKNKRYSPECIYGYFQNKYLSNN